MNRTRNGGGWSSNLHSSPSSSSRDSPHEHKVSNGDNDMSSHLRTPHQRRNSLETEERSNSRHSQETQVLDEQSWPSLRASCDKSTSSSKERCDVATTSESAMSHNGRSPIAGYPLQQCEPLSPTQAVSTTGPSKVERNIVMGHHTPSSKDHTPRPRKISPKRGRDIKSVGTSKWKKVERDGGMGNSSPERSINHTQPTCDPLPVIPVRVMESESRKDTRHISPERSADEVYRIDICPEKKRTIVLENSLFDKNREKRKDPERSKNDNQQTILRPGMVLLKNFLSHTDQIKIIKMCRDLGVGDSGFYQPGYKDGAKLSLHMMCLGMDWDPQRRTYERVRAIDGAEPPIVPAEFKRLVNEAIQKSHVVMGEQRVRNPDKAIPWMEPDICIVNFYPKSGKLGLHQDRDESAESIMNELPVVSFSIGDSTEFLYGDERDVDKAKKVELKSGDVLIFGGKSRLIYHGVPSIVPDSAPKFLANEANFRPGRLNLTFRKY